MPFHPPPDHILPLPLRVILAPSEDPGATASWSCSSMPPSKRSRRKPPVLPVSASRVELSGGDAVPAAQLEMWQSGALCDAKVLVDGREFLAHRVVLATASPFMRGLLTNSMTESQTGTIQMREMEPTVFEACLQWVYSGECSLEEGILMKMLDAATLLQMTSLLAAASEAVTARLDAQNCLQALQYADRYGLQSMRDAAKEVAADNFSLLSLEVVCALDEAQLGELLALDSLDVDREEQVYEVLLAWARQSGRMPPAVLRCIHFEQLAPAYLASNVYEEPLMQTVEAMRVAAQGFESAYHQGSTPARGARLRQAVRMTGGTCELAEEGVLVTYKTGNGSWSFAHGVPLASSEKLIEWTVRMVKQAVRNSWSLIVGIGECSRVERYLALGGVLFGCSAALCFTASLNGLGSLMETLPGTLADPAGRVSQVQHGGYAGIDSWAPKIEVGDEVHLRYDVRAGTLALAVNDGEYRVAFKSLPQEPMNIVVALGEGAQLRLMPSTRSTRRL